MPRKRRKGKSHREERVEYALTVTDWDYYYSFRPGDTKWDVGPYAELVTLDFWGVLRGVSDSRISRAKVRKLASIAR